MENTNGNLDQTKYIDWLGPLWIPDKTKYGWKLPKRSLESRWRDVLRDHNGKWELGLEQVIL